MGHFLPFSTFYFEFSRPLIPVHTIGIGLLLSYHILSYFLSSPNPIPLCFSRCDDLDSLLSISFFRSWSDKDVTSGSVSETILMQISKASIISSISSRSLSSQVQQSRRTFHMESMHRSRSTGLGGSSGTSFQSTTETIVLASLDRKYGIFLNIIS